MAQRELHAFAHVTASRVGFRRIVSEVGGAERAAHDIAQIEDTGDVVVFAPTNEQAHEVWLPVAFQITGELEP